MDPPVKVRTKAYPPVDKCDLRYTASEHSAGADWNSDDSERLTNAHLWYDLAASKAWFIRSSRNSVSRASVPSNHCLTKQVQLGPSLPSHKDAMLRTGCSLLSSSLKSSRIQL